MLNAPKSSCLFAHKASCVPFSSPRRWRAAGCRAPLQRRPLPGKVMRSTFCEEPHASSPFTCDCHLELFPMGRDAQPVQLCPCENLPTPISDNFNDTCGSLGWRNKFCFFHDYLVTLLCNFILYSFLFNTSQSPESFRRGNKSQIGF